MSQLECYWNIFYIDLDILFTDYSSYSLYVTSRVTRILTFCTDCPRCYKDWVHLLCDFLVLFPFVSWICRRSESSEYTWGCLQRKSLYIIILYLLFMLSHMTNLSSTEIPFHSSCRSISSCVPYSFGRGVYKALDNIQF